MAGDDQRSQPRLESEAVDDRSPTDSARGAASVGPDPLADDDRTFRFVEGPCRFEPPADFQPRCGTVAVPEDWDTGQGEVVLSVAVFSSTAADPQPDPVVYLDGGPGSHALETIEFVVDDFLEPLLTRGDVIFFDQRGVGLTSPRLDCPETEVVNRQIEDRPFVDDEEETEALHRALGDCRNRLIEAGIDLTDYNSINNAHDVEAIRRALGYDRWNLFGISYGTKLGLEVLRRHPDPVRSAILDSVYPPQVDSVLETPSPFVDSYQLIVGACSAEPACDAEGDLAERIRSVVARYEADPVRVEVQDWILDETDQVFVTGDTIVGVVVGALYSPSRFTDIPELVAELEEGRTEAIAAFLSQDRTTERFFSNGMFYAVACTEEIGFADEAQVAAAVPADPFGLKEVFDFASNTGNLAFGTCRAFETDRAPDVSNTAVNSDVPTLLMAGTYDPVTPVAWAERAAETLSRSQLVIGPHAAHGVSGDTCGISIAIAFLDSPGRRPDDGCLAEQQLEFLAGVDRQQALESVTYRIEDFGVEISTVRPTDWFVGSLEGDQYRRASFLDPTELYQLAGDPSLGFVLADFIEAEQRLTLSEARPFAGRVGPISADGIPRNWDRRSGRSASVAVEWFETVIDGQATYVILVAPVDQLETGLESVVLPALGAIDVVAM
ncbi:MAG: alpha/beta fold hydrolase [Acidimicrobiales bacterium]